MTIKFLALKLNLVFEWDPKIFEFEKNYQNRNHRFKNLKVEAQTYTYKSNQPSKC